MGTPVKWAAHLTRVREVSLRGTADLEYWTSRLAPERLQPEAVNGRAQLMILGADSKFHGVPFREISISVIVKKLPAWPDAAFLTSAYNSCRFFAFCERVFFSTPYRHAEVWVSSTSPVSLGVTIRGKAVFLAEMDRDALSRRDPDFCGDQTWDGPIFLPTVARSGEGKLFLGLLNGHTRTFPYVPSEDRFTFDPEASDELLRPLADSNYLPQRWSIRENAEHSKSKTYRRSQELTNSVDLLPAIPRLTGG